MRFSSGLDFEDLVFSRHSDGDKMRAEFADQIPNFSIDVESLIRDNCEAKHPDTLIGGDFWRRLNSKLSHIGVQDGSVLFLSTVGSIVDLKHYADGVVYLPSVPEFPITIDLYSIDEKEVSKLRKEWADGFDGDSYSFFDFQNDLFKYKAGRSRWFKNLEIARDEGFDLIGWPKDFRIFASYLRPRNHFIWTPWGVTRHGRKFFSTLFAEYFASKISYPKRARYSP